MTVIARRSLRLAVAAILLALATAVVPPASVDGQVARAGQTIAPVYEGWESNADGSFNLVFGYLNRNWEEEFHLPIGPANSIEPNGPDQGQPTYFFPRRNRFVFRIRVPKDFGNKELVWSLTTQGKTERAYATLKPDYVLDDMILMSNIGAGGALSSTPDMVGNQAPTVVVEGGSSRTTVIAAPLSLVATTSDNRKPTPRRMTQVLGQQLHAAELGQRIARVVVHVSRTGQGGQLRSAAEQGLGRHPGRRQLTLVGGVDQPASSSRWSMGRACNL